MDADVHGVRATIIDLGLARMQAGAAGVDWTPFDAETFEGEGDYQFDVYRMMRAHNGDAWEAYRPLTNVMVRAPFYLVSYLRGESDGGVAIVAALPCGQAVACEATAQADRAEEQE